jgi:hypothetical protein
MAVRAGRSVKIWDGHAFHLSAYHRPAFSTLTVDRGPRLNFSGQWVGPHMKMNGEGSIGQAFLADGSMSLTKASPAHIEKDKR